MLNLIPNIRIKHFSKIKANTTLRFNVLDVKAELQFCTKFILFENHVFNPR
mgnify:CR=1 FL=1